MSPTHIFFISSLSCSKGASVSIKKVKKFFKSFLCSKCCGGLYMASFFPLSQIVFVLILFQEIKDEGILWKVNFPRFHQHFIDMVG